MIHPQKISLKFLKKSKESKDAYTFYFEKKDLNYLAGQYVKVVLDIKNPDERGNSRFFTLASSPDEKNIYITTRIIKSSFKMVLGKLSPGQEVLFSGPFGNFVLTDDKKPLIFLAGGIGITPFHSMVKFVADNKLNRQIRLFVSWKGQEDLIYHDELKKISTENKNIAYIPTITNSDSSSAWSGERGRIDEGKIKKYITDISNPIFYISGPLKMVEAMEKMIREMGVAGEKIKTDKFPGY